MENLSADKLLTILVMAIIIGLTIKLIKGTMKFIICIFVAVIAISTIMSGCGRVIRDTDEISENSYSNKNAVTSDGNTVSFFDVASNSNTNGVVRDTELEENISRLDSEQKETGHEQEIYGMINAEFMSYGINGQTEIGDMNYISETEYMVYGRNTSSNLSVVAMCDNSTGEIQVSTEGAYNGSDYIVFNNIDKLNCEIDIIDSILYDNGIYYNDIGIIDDVQDSNVYITLGNDKYAINTSEYTVEEIMN